MQVQIHGSNGLHSTIATAAPLRRRKLYLPLALETRPMGAALRPQTSPTLSGHELRRIVAGVLG